MGRRRRSPQPGTSSVSPGGGGSSFGWATEMGTPTRQVVIVGGGFAGLYAAQALAKADAKVTVIDRQNHHLFQPMLYQVATAALSPGDIASPIRSILRSQLNTEVILGEVVRVDVPARSVVLADGGSYHYDYLIVC